MAKSSKKPRVVVVLKGGRVDEVYSDKSIEVEVLDNDTEGVSTNCIVNVNGGHFYVYGGESFNGPDKAAVDSVFEAIKASNIHG